MKNNRLIKQLPLRPELAAHTTVKVIGLGGVGGIVARYGAMFLASLPQPTRLVLCDGDRFEPSNATRMFFSNCGNKAAITRAELLPRFVDSHLTLVAVEEYVTAANISRLLRNRDLVILTVDNHATRKLVSDYCESHLNDVCLISGGNDGVGKDSTGRGTRGTCGNVQVYLRRGGRNVGPSLTTYHPEIAQPTDHLPTELSCTELVSSVPQILFANLTVAAAILNTFWLHVCGALPYHELAFDIAAGLMRPCVSVDPQAKPRPTRRAAGLKPIMKVSSR